jgi:hypothetical protein
MPELDDLQGHTAANRLFLLRHIDHPVAAFPKPLK